MFEYIVKFFIVMIAMIITDVCWAYYFIKIGERKATHAGIWAVLLFLSGAVVTTNYVGDNTLIIAAAMGAFIGTWITVEFKKHNEDKEKITNK